MPSFINPTSILSVASGQTTTQTGNTITPVVEPGRGIGPDEQDWMVFYEFAASGGSGTPGVNLSIEQEFSTGKWAVIGLVEGLSPTDLNNGPIYVAVAPGKPLRCRAIPYGTSAPTFTCAVFLASTGPWSS